VGWSSEQIQAIETRGCNLLVAAAAGSGKTSVLVERIIHQITMPGPQGEEPIDVDRMLVVTFTSAAAAEMRSRIAARIAAMQQQKFSRRLARQAALLNSANISTIHSFCQSVVRKYFYLLDLDPGFRVGAAAEMELLKADVLEQVFADCYEADDPGFSLLIDHYADADGDDTLMQLVLNLYEFSRSHPWPEHWLRQLASRFDLPAETGIDDTPWSNLLRQEILLQLENRAWALDRLIREAEADPDFGAYAETFAADSEIIGELILAARLSWAKLEQAFVGLDFVKLKTVRGGDEDRREYFKSRRDAVKKAVNGIRDSYFARSGADLIVDMRGLAPLVSALAQLVIAFSAAFSQTKRKKSVLDFSDLEHFCLAVLLDESSSPGDPKPSAAALQMRESFAEVLVDEYQDTNGVQETILVLLTRDDPPNRFMVGDVKQSIYRFRLAEPRLFMEKYRSYPSEGVGPCRRIDLAANFRSRALVLHASNFLFGQLMTEAVAELDYGEAERLNPGLDYPPCADSLAGVELHLLERRPQDTEAEQAVVTESESDSAAGQSSHDGSAALDSFSREAAWIAGRISQLMQGGHQVYDKETKGYRPLGWRDIVILLRSVQGKAQPMLDLLRAAGIPCYADMDTGYFRETEVGIIVSLLQILDNPRQDIHLAGVLRSPLFHFSGQELALMRVAESGKEHHRDLWDSLLSMAQEETQQPLIKEKTAAFITTIARWRSLARRRSVAELLWLIYEETGFYDYAGGMPGGAFRQANLRALFDRARQYEATNYRGLFRFLRFIEALTARGADLAVARALGENENVVRIMSIHKSKGLEFPVVFVADIGKEINLSDTRELVLCHRDWGIGPYVTLPNQGYRYPTLARWAIAQQLRRETKAEELRILYVALTRARERLILVGSARDLAAKCAAWAESATSGARTLPEAQTAAAKTYLDWIVPALVRHPDGAPLREAAGITDTATPEGLEIDTIGSCWQITLDFTPDTDSDQAESEQESDLWQQMRQLQPVSVSSDAAEIRRILNWQYPYSAVVGQPAKLTVTEIKRRMAETAAEAKQLYTPTLYSRPRFTGEKKLTGAQLGTVTHLVMQRIQPQLGLPKADIARQVEFMTAAEFLLPEEAAAVDIDAVAAFFTSDLGKRMQQALWVKKELPFSLMLPAERFAPAAQGSGDSVFVQGTLDCLFAEPDGLVLLDYKTDYTADTRQLAERYAVQLSLYAEAVTAIIGQPVKEKFIYSFCRREAVPVE
jgi:ATP-dependent helicase/nuclease subunit A